jgi:hypothetical protein
MTQTLVLIIALATAGMTALAFYYNNWIRFIVIALLVMLANMIYFTFDGVKGWPAEEEKEVKGILATVVIINPSDKNTGGIIISLFPTVPTEWYEYEYHRYAPKTFFIEYSNDRAAQFEAAKQALVEGKEVRINGIPDATSTGGQEGAGEGSVEYISDIVGNFLERMLPKQGDTYRPDIPDIEIFEQTAPPQKGTNQ